MPAGPAVKSARAEPLLEVKRRKTSYNIALLKIKSSREKRNFSVFADFFARRSKKNRAIEVKGAWSKRNETEYNGF